MEQGTDTIFQPTLLTFARGAFIMMEGKKNPDRFFVIQQGKVWVIREADHMTAQESSMAGPGEIVGAV